MSLLLYLLVNIGITIIVTQSRLFKSFRNFMTRVSPSFFGILFTCTMCFGWWSGLLTSLIWFSPTAYYVHYVIYLNPLLDGFLSSIVCYTFYLLIKPLMNKYD